MFLELVKKRDQKIVVALFELLAKRPVLNRILSLLFILFFIFLHPHIIPRLPHLLFYFSSLLPFFLYINFFVSFFFLIHYKGEKRTTETKNKSYAGGAMKNVAFSEEKDQKNKANGRGHKEESRSEESNSGSGSGSESDSGSETGSATGSESSEDEELVAKRSWIDSVLRRPEKGDTDGSKLQHKKDEKGKKKVETDVAAQRSAVYGALAGSKGR